MELTRKATVKFTANALLTFRNVITGRITQIAKHNLVVDDGLESIVARLTGVDIPASLKGTITYCAVGTGTDAVTAGDTKLQTEIERKQIAVRTPTGTTGSFRAFFNTSEAVGTLRELGLFGDDASGTADTGTLFARLAINKTKTDAQTLTIDWNITLSAS